MKLDPLPENKFPQLKLDQLMEENRFAHLVLDLEYHAVQLTRQLGEVRPHLNNLTVHKRLERITQIYGNVDNFGNMIEICPLNKYRYAAFRNIFKNRL